MYKVVISASMKDDPQEERSGNIRGINLTGTLPFVPVQGMTISVNADDTSKTYSFIECKTVEWRIDGEYFYVNGELENDQMIRYEEQRDAFHSLKGWVVVEEML